MASRKRAKTSKNIKAVRNIPTPINGQRTKAEWKGGENLRDEKIEEKKKGWKKTRLTQSIIRVAIKKIGII